MKQNKNYTFIFWADYGYLLQVLRIWNQLLFNFMEIPFISINILRRGF